MYKNLKLELLKSSDLELKEQNIYLETALKNWTYIVDKNGKKYEQTDDICMLGIRFLYPKKIIQIDCISFVLQHRNDVIARKYDEAIFMRHIRLTLY